MSVTVYHAEALEWLRTQPDKSFDSVLCDPPAGIGFMSNRNSWDSDKGGREQWTAWLTEVMREVLRVLKPGAHGLVWSIPQTSAWTGWALESAGFEIRNCVYHMVGNRIPKNHAVAKNIDKKLGGVRKKVGTKRLGGNAGVSLKDKGGTYGVGVGTADAIDVDITESDTEEAKAFDGHGTALRALVEPWWLVRKPIEGTIVGTALRYGTGVLNVEGCRVGSDSVRINRFIDGAKPFGEAAGLEFEGVDSEGRWPGNIVIDEVFAADLDASVGERPSTLTGRADPNARHDNPGDNGGTSSFGGGNSAVYADDGGPSRFYKICPSDCVYTSKIGTWEKEFGCESLPLSQAGNNVGRKEGSVGIKNGRAGAGRTGPRRNVHSTVKPISLTEYLATLLLIPPRKDGPRRIVVPFAGVGSEMIGAMRAGWEEVVGVEADFDKKGFVEIARARIARWQQIPAHLTVDEIRKTAEKKSDSQSSLFDLASGIK